ncbi:MAG: class I SAM-dependent DNA methyltransferase [Lysobacteraceae bacterium]
MSNERMDASVFIAKWKDVRASELSTSQSFLIDLCALLGVDTPHPTPAMDYMFERPVTFVHGDGSESAGRIDLYRRGHFVLESKKIKVGSHTKGFDEAMLRARSQAESYARALPGEEGRPPFLIVVDVGQRIELYAEFSRSGGTYTPYPDPRAHRIAIDDLAREDIRDRLKRIWTDPMSLDPARMSAKVTREIAAKLAELAKSLESAGHPADAVAQFLMRCLFTMFAEDVRLLPEESFRQLLVRHAAEPEVAMQMLAQLWRDMDQGGFSAVLAGRVLRFNGKLFKQPETLPLEEHQIALLIEAARADWRHVEPAIFGTLLERALNPSERHKLGAHYTPRAYVERLVMPTVIEPLREEWADAQAAALTLAAEGDASGAISEIQKFHHRLCAVRVLDPACGSGNFLYVTLEHLKRLEGEVLNALDELGYRQTGLALSGERADASAGETVDPHNLLGIELNPRAAAIAEVVLWIGYLQWHFRTRGDVSPPVPVIRDFRNIENRDAVLAYDSVELVTDAAGFPVTRWDGNTMKPSPVTGEDIPDDSVRVPVERYVNPRKADWPKADFVVGNPPFIGNKRMRTALGDGYVEALRGAWHDVPDSADFVMYWWHQAAEKARLGELERFGLIPTTSMRQAFNRKVVETHLRDPKLPLSLVFAVPDHPWVDTSDGAGVRISMSVGATGAMQGESLTLVSERELDDGEVECAFSAGHGRVHSDLSAGTALVDARGLKANQGLAFTGMYPLGQGFVVLPEEIRVAAGDDRNVDNVLKPFATAKDLTQRSREARIVDFYPRTMSEARDAYPNLFQWVLDRVKPERDQNPVEERRKNWWLFTCQRRSKSDPLCLVVAD